MQMRRQFNLGKTLLAGTSAASLVLLSACANGLGANDYERGAVGAISRVDEGVVVSSRKIVIEGNNGTGAGAAVGGALGGLGGSQLGNGGAGTIAAGIGLAVVGAIVGGAAGKAITREGGYAYTVQLKGKSDLLTITQGDDVPIANGSKVFVEYGPRARVIPQDSQISAAR